MTAWVKHSHHKILFEPLTEPIEHRLEDIKAHKPAEEIETRLRLLRVLTDEEVALLPSVLVKVGDAYVAARDAYDKARNAYAKALDAYDKARNAFYYKAGDAYDKARDAYLAARDAYEKAGDALYKALDACDKAWDARRPELEALHSQLCVPDCPWDGQTLFPKAVQA